MVLANDSAHNEKITTNLKQFQQSINTNNKPMKHQLLFVIVELFAIFGIFRCGGSIFVCRVPRDTIILVNNLLYSLFRRAEDIHNLFKEFVVHIFDVVDAKLLRNLSLFERQVEIEICYHNYKPIKLLFSSVYFWATVAVRLQS